MKTSMVVKTLLVLILLATSLSCTLMDYIHPYKGDLKLLRMQIPELSTEDLAYDVSVTFEAEGRPTIKRACFRWLTERASVSSPPLYCYAWEVQSNAPIDSVCSRWAAEGTYGEMSPLFCTNVEQVEYGSPGRIVTKLQTQNVQLYYHNIECYVEYVINGETRQSNKIKSRITVVQ